MPVKGNVVCASTQTGRSRDMARMDQRRGSARNLDPGERLLGQRRASGLLGAEQAVAAEQNGEDDDKGQDAAARRLEAAAGTLLDRRATGRLDHW